MSAHQLAPAALGPTPTTIRLVAESVRPEPSPAPVAAFDGGPAWLRAHPWQLHHVLGNLIVDSLIFLSDGQVWATKEVLWRWHYEKNRLVITSLDGTQFIEFIRRQTKDNNLILDGRLTVLPDMAFEMVMSPKPEAPPLADTTRDFNASVVLGTQSETLLVIINSAHRPYEGREYGPQWRWEFYELPEKIGVDHIRLCEGNAPVNWYTNKTRRVLKLLESVIDHGYKQVVFCGMSSGGYASLWFAETLSGMFPGVMFKTVTINPQTGHNIAHRQAILPMSAYAPALITDHALAMRDCAETEIYNLAQARATEPTPRGNVAHSVYYDAANPVEDYYVKLVADLPGFALKSFSFGIGHMSACIALYERRVAHIEVDEICRAASLRGIA